MNGEAGYVQAQPAVFPGFAVQEFACGRCGHEWIGVAAVGTHGLRCPKCDLYDREFVWLGPKPWSNHDGAWLTGSWLLPWWQAPEAPTQPATAHPAAAGCSAQDAQDDEDIDAFTGEPRSCLKRWLQRLQCAWWALKGEF